MSWATIVSSHARPPAADGCSPRCTGMAGHVTEGAVCYRRPVPPASGQLASEGISNEEIVAGALAAARPEPGLRWLDIGCGRGALLRRIRDEWSPAGLWGIDPIDWLEEDLRGEVEFTAVAAERAIDLPQVDRVMMVEVIEHLEA